MYCKKCENQINEFQKFCPVCGTKVELSEKTAEINSTPTPTPIYSPETSTAVATESAPSFTPATASIPKMTQPSQLNKKIPSKNQQNFLPLVLVGVAELSIFILSAINTLLYNVIYSAINYQLLTLISAIIGLVTNVITIAIIVFLGFTVSKKFTKIIQFVGSVLLAEFIGRRILNGFLTSVISGLSYTISSYKFYAVSNVLSTVASIFCTIISVALAVFIYLFIEKQIQKDKENTKE